IFWEGVGVCSYLLIGHWFERPVDPVAYEQAEVETTRTGIAITPSEAGKKAFVTTRLGDVGFLIGILLLFTLTLRIGEPTLDFARLADLAENGALDTFGTGLGTIAMILLFCGAIGKSAQFPLHVWLP